MERKRKHIIVGKTDIPLVVQKSLDNYSHTKMTVLSFATTSQAIEFLS